MVQGQSSGRGLKGSSLEVVYRLLHIQKLMSHRPMHSVFSTFLYVFSARDLGVVIDGGLTTSDHVTADNLHVKL